MKNGRQGKEKLQFIIMSDILITLLILIAKKKRTKLLSHPNILYLPVYITIS